AAPTALPKLGPFFFCLQPFPAARSSSENRIDRVGGAGQLRRMPAEPPDTHAHQHAFSFLNPRERGGLTVFARRAVLKASRVGLAGVTLPRLLQLRAEGGAAGRRSKAVILLWMT